MLDVGLYLHPPLRLLHRLPARASVLLVTLYHILLSLELPG